MLDFRVATFEKLLAQYDASEQQTLKNLAALPAEQRAPYEQQIRAQRTGSAASQSFCRSKANDVELRPKAALGLNPTVAAAAAVRRVRALADDALGLGTCSPKPVSTGELSRASVRAWK